MFSSNQTAQADNTCERSGGEREKEQKKKADLACVPSVDACNEEYITLLAGPVPLTPRGKPSSIMATKSKLHQQGPFLILT